MIYCYNPNDPYMGIIIEDEDNPDFVRIKSFVYSNDLEMMKEKICDLINEEISKLRKNESDLQDLLLEIYGMEEE